MVSEDLFTQRVIFMREIGKMIKLKDKEYYKSKMGPFIQGNGRMINKMVLVQRNGLMAQFIQVSIEKA